MIERWHEPHALQSVRLKIGRAETHLGEIDGFITMYAATNPLGIAYELNSEKTHFEGRLRAKFPPFLDFGIVAGEVSYQLRSALDNLVYALCSPNFPNGFGSRARERAERSSFFSINRVRNDDAILGGISFVADEVREDVFAAIDKHQPYKLGQSAEEHPLSALDEVCNRDKHRVINAATGAITFSATSRHQGVRVLSQVVGDNDIVLQVPVELDPEADVHPQMSYDIILPVGRPAGGMKITFLRTICDYVKNQVVPDFLVFFPPEEDN